MFLLVLVFVISEVLSSSSTTSSVRIYNSRSKDGCVENVFIDSARVFSSTSSTHNCPKILLEGLVYDRVLGIVHKLFHYTKLPVPLFKYSARRLIGLQIWESAAYCDQILPMPLYLNRTQYPKTTCSYSVIVITFMLAQSDLFKRRQL